MGERQQPQPDKLHSVNQKGKWKAEIGKPVESVRDLKDFSRIRRGKKFNQLPAGSTITDKIREIPDPDPRRMKTEPPEPPLPPDRRG